MGTNTLYDEDWFTHQSSSALEAFIGEPFSCAISNIQTAIQACLELLGTRSEIIPVIMPVTSAPDVLAGVLRSGAHPILLDINEETLQMDAGQLKDAKDILLAENNTPIVLFNRPFGAPVSGELIELVLDLASIVDSRLLPHHSLGADDASCTFNIFDLTPVCGSGALVVHKYPEQIKHLKLVRSGPMGLSGALPELQAKVALNKLKDYSRRAEEHRSTVCSLEHNPRFYGPYFYPAPLWFKVDNAKLFVAGLQAEGIEAVVALTPLFKLEEVKIRYKEPPEYPIASKLENKFICTSYDKDVVEKVKLLL